MKNLHKLITNDQYDIGGLCTEPKGNVIKSLVKDSNAKLCVEIGVFKGSSLLYFAEALQETGGKVIGIDPYEIESLKNEIPNKQVSHIIYNVLFKEQTTLDNLYSNLTQIIEENKLNNVVKLIRDKSENYYQNIKSESIDVLHIDGNHDEEYVSKDILNYLPLVKKGGYIIMDDITWVGVKNSINNHLINSCHLMSDHVDFSVYIKD
jgi:predicted O-methyltransferase YrrM